MTSIAKTLLFWIMVLVSGVLLYQAVQHGSSGRVFSAPNSASARIMLVGRLGYAELLMIFVVALLVWAPVLTNRQRFNALTVTLNAIFNKTFFVTLTIILALFGLAALWLLRVSH